MAEPPPTSDESRFLSGIGSAADQALSGDFFRYADKTDSAKASNITLLLRRTNNRPFALKNCNNNKWKGRCPRYGLPACRWPSNSRVVIQVFGSFVGTNSMEVVRQLLLGVLQPNLAVVSDTPSEAVYAVVIASTKPARDL